ALDQLKELESAYRDSSDTNPDDPVLLYALGLCLSFSGEKNRDDLFESISLIEKSLSIHPSMGYGYLTLGFNYEQLERGFARSREPPSSILSKSAHTATEVLRRLRNLLQLGSSLREFRGYEKAIEILQLGLAVNDERSNPQLEAQLLLNLGNNYYQLGEFAYPKALEAFLRRLQIDSTSSSPLHEAINREKMGRAAAIMSRNETALESFQAALRFYQDARYPEGEFRILLRIAELYQANHDPELSNEYYQKALVIAAREGIRDEYQKWLENMAFNALKLKEYQSASNWTNQALTHLPPPEKIRIYQHNNPLVLEILGIPIPVWNFGYLGTGSPVSATGFHERDELLLNLSALQESHFQQKDLPESRREILRRLAIAVTDIDIEAQAILWSELGFVDWLSGERVLAKRDFIRSLNLCKTGGFQAGWLSALTNLACLELISAPLEDSSTDYLAMEIRRFADHSIGFSKEQWLNVKSILEQNLEQSTTSKLREILTVRLQEFDPYPETAVLTPWDFSLLFDLLLWHSDPIVDRELLLKMIKNELSRYQRDPFSFQTEHLQLFNVYAQLCFQKANALPGDELHEQLRRLETEGEALWAFEQGIQSATNAKRNDQAMILRIGIGDFWFSAKDYNECAEEWLTALHEAEQDGRDDFLWRIYWRLGRVAEQLEQGYVETSSLALQEILQTPSEEWYELAISLVPDLPEEALGFYQTSQRALELEIMLQLAIQNAMIHYDYDKALQYLQYLDNAPIFEACQTRMVSVASERRKILWSAGVGNVPYLRSRIFDLKSKKDAKEQADEVDQNRSAERLHTTLLEYKEIIAELSLEDPEFYSLFSLIAFAQDSLQKALQPGALVLKVFILDDQVNLLSLDKSAVSFFPNVCGIKQFQEAWDCLHLFNSDDPRYLQSAEE
ncbi:MAG: tetratricopeptide repeat protein, partial [bacterium]